ncbi:uncharacterized protein LOC127831441 [Dreissena polymorpha]|uniref:uncharacterized protein LOC127831441 n=1 Tax=Dreissena polymorpha TaxID=45954 RepID=UPI002264F570|nr:uncharacterized protein LOC127831441 [Dreissena polymorpha]
MFIGLLEVASNITNVFKTKKIEAAVDKASNLLGLPRNHILPVKNYENEMELDDNISILALMTLRQVLHFAEDYLQVLQNKLKACGVSIEKLDKRESVEKGSDQDKTREGVVNKISGLLRLPRNNILPVKNYENEMELDDNISILALLSLRQLLFYAEDYLQIL